jgi:hypothetical protein
MSQVSSKGVDQASSPSFALSLTTIRAEDEEQHGHDRGVVDL